MPVFAVGSFILTGAIIECRARFHVVGDFVRKVLFESGTLSSKFCSPNMCDSPANNIKFHRIYIVCTTYTAFN